MLDPPRTASRTKKKKKNTSSPLIGAPVQSQEAKDARVRAIKISRISHLAVLASWRFFSPSTPFSAACYAPRSRAGGH